MKMIFGLRLALANPIDGRRPTVANAEPIVAMKRLRFM
jgi:hypothetical protein